ncbi:MAG: hypothetical protein WCT04_09965 [Planctomycetota bacterium]
MRKQLLISALALVFCVTSCPELLAASDTAAHTTLVKGKNKEKKADKKKDKAGKKGKKEKKGKKAFNAQKKIDKFLAKHGSELKLTSDQESKIKALSGAKTKKELKHGIKKILTKAQKKQLKADHKAKHGKKNKGEKKNKKTK